MKKQYLLGTTVLTIGVFIGSYKLTPTHAEVDLQDASTQLGILDTVIRQNEHQDQVLDNHEDRITNSEKDIVSLQSNTSTPPSTEKVIVREVQVPAPEPEIEPEPEPVVVTSYRQIPIEGSEDMDCEYTYTDGSKWRWHWQTVEYNQGTRIIRKSGHCDDRAIGSQDKPGS